MAGKILLQGGKVFGYHGREETGGLGVEFGYWPLPDALIGWAGVLDAADRGIAEPKELLDIFRDQVELFLALPQLRFRRPPLSDLRRQFGGAFIYPPFQIGVEGLDFPILDDEGAKEPADQQ